MCGDPVYSNLLDASIRTISQEDFENMISSHTVYFNANGGSVSTQHKSVVYNSTYGILPTPTKDYHRFDGWFTAQTGGIKVNSGDIFTGNTDVTLYAHWIQKKPSDWTLASNVPSDAEIINRKWEYDVTEYTSSNQSSLSGWELYNTSSYWSDYGGWSDWTTNPINGSDSRQVDTKVDTYTVLNGYNLDCYNTRTTGGERQFRNYSVNGNYSGYGLSSVYGEYHYSTYASVDEVRNASTVSAGNYTNQCTYPGRNSGNTTGYILYYGESYYVFFITSENRSQASTTYYRYRDRQLIYTYYYKKTNHVTSEYEPNGNNISNKTQYVKYRMK